MQGFRPQVGVIAVHGFEKIHVIRPTQYLLHLGRTLLCRVQVPLWRQARVNQRVACMAVMVEQGTVA